MAVNSGDECPNVHSIVVLPDGDGEAPNLQYQHLLNVRYVEVPKMMKSNGCSNTEPNSQSNTMEKVNNVSCSFDIDIEKGHEDSVNNEHSAADWKSDDHLAREACSLIRGKFIQLVMNLGSDLLKFTLRDKFATERVYETPTHRTRKYKRYPSFNSRRVVILFSVLSSVGTIILIYLTLRVRQINDGAGNV